MKLKTNLMTTALSILTSLTSLAGDIASFESLGFSKNGQYYAFMQTSVLDGSGFPMASISVIEPKKNKLVSYKRVIIEDHEQDYEKSMQQTIQAAIEKAKLSHFAIKPRKVMGQTWISRQEGDVSEYKNTRFVTDPYGDSFYELNVTTQEAPKNEDSQYCMFPELLKVTIEDTENNEVTVLQDDHRLPKSRACAHNYSISHVFTHKGSLVVIVPYNEDGFEGPNSRFMSVGGKFEE